jgi:hypothetical protein
MCRVITSRQKSHAVALPSVTGHLRDLVAHFEPVSLERLEESASLHRRVDNKYVIDRDQLQRLVARLKGEHRVLEIDGERASAIARALD